MVELMDDDQLEVADSGHRRTFKTGAQRDRAEGKGRHDLLFGAWYALDRAARHYERGAKKYTDRNWEQGMPMSDYFASAIRHLGAIMVGDHTEDHYGALLFNALGLVETLERCNRGLYPPDLKDLPNPTILEQKLKQLSGKIISACQDAAANITEEVKPWTDKETGEFMKSVAQAHGERTAKLVRDAWDGAVQKTGDGFTDAARELATASAREVASRIQ